ncbi:globin domain-containing protein [Antrihabitans sp. YC2-6]|uniref:globin domain-containing protein n=1 Tax=Antrihabitans sp. YC2-6 TaxID=2799498 RepID=UPI0018F556E6|nr:globin domain-containing protein [Antrihabitans sp. YC2-6]MBJ8348720.1 flavoprotein [Antrihabitans sp. YC2-6]
MDSRTISLVRTTFKAVAAEDDGPERLTRSFYAILFAEYPGVRDFFPAAMDHQRDRLVKALAYCVDRLEDTENLLPFLAQLGRDHRKYGTVDAHYVAVGNSLVKALRTFTGNEIWTEEVDRAWNQVLGVIASTMIGAANAESNPPVWGGTVIGHKEILRNLAVIRLQLSQPMEYEAGQYVSVQVPSRPRMWRYLSPANPANANGEIEFHVRGVSGGWVSPSLVGHTRVGDQWLLGSPLGSLGVAGSEGRDMLMIGCGTGIAPLRAQVMAMAQRRLNPRVHVFVGGHHPCDLYDLETMWQLSLTNPWLTVTPVSEHEENPWWYGGGSGYAPAGFHERLTGQIGKVVASMGSWSERDIQICGSPAMIQTTKFRLMAGGTPTKNIRHDPLY